jgi:hypothetical protein
MPVAEAGLEIRDSQDKEGNGNTKTQVPESETWGTFALLYFRESCSSAILQPISLPRRFKDMRPRHSLKTERANFAAQVY